MIIVEDGPTITIRRSKRPAQAVSRLVRLAIRKGITVNPVRQGWIIGKRFVYVAFGH